MNRLLTTVRDFAVLTSLLPLLTLPVTASTAELPLVRIAPAPSAKNRGPVGRRRAADFP